MKGNKRRTDTARLNFLESWVRERGAIRLYREKGAPLGIRKAIDLRMNAAGA